MPENSPENRANVFQRALRWIGSLRVKNILILVCSLLIFFGLYCLVCSPKQYDLSVGSISRDTINATKDVVDEITTEEKRQAAANAVEPTYRFQDGVKEEVLSSIDNIFSELRTVQQYGQTLVDPDGRPSMNFSDAETDYALNLISSVSFSRYQITTLLRTGNESFEDMVSTVTTAVENALNTTIREGQMNQTIQTILQIVGFKLDISLTQNIIPTVLRACLKPNMVVDQEATDIARQAAMDAVEPIVYLQGQNIIRSGDRITRSQLEMLRSLGLLKNDSYDFSSYQGAAVLVILAMLCFAFSLRIVGSDVLRDSKKLLVSMIVSILGFGISIIFHLFLSPYFVPMVFVPVLLCALLGAETGYASIAPTAVLLSGLAAGNNSTYLYEMILIILMCLVGGVFAVRIMKSHPQRVRVLLAGGISALVNAAIIPSVHWMTSTESVNLLEMELWAVGGGLVSGILAIGFQPVFESLFNLATPSRLMDLCNPNHRLLRRLQIEAPGTYHHSLIVGNLAEAAAERIGANPYLARAAGYYHDIGKMKRPMYFKENQTGENPHDKMDPYVSAAILTSHAQDGYQMALKDKMPHEVADIILQHHGDTPVMFFYHKALQMSNGSPVDIAEFRYNGPRPNTKEAAIVMLADTIEAAVRSMQDPTPKSIAQFIERLVRGKLEDGQLSDSPLTLRDIDEIVAAFNGILIGVFHERIEYPEVQHHVPAQPAARSDNAAGGEKISSAGSNHAASKAAVTDKTKVPVPEDQLEPKSEAEPTESKTVPKSETEFKPEEEPGTVKSEEPSVPEQQLDDTADKAGRKEESEGNEA